MAIWFELAVLCSFPRARSLDGEDWHAYVRKRERSRPAQDEKKGDQSGQPHVCTRRAAPYTVVRHFCN
jgi:hypothetical protein